MIFNKDNYPVISEACRSKKPIKFLAPRAVTAFDSGSAPQEWELVSPNYLLPEDYAHVFARIGSDARSALTRLELLVHLDGGQMHYRAEKNDMVEIRVSWPQSKVP